MLEPYPHLHRSCRCLPSLDRGLQIVSTLDVRLIWPFDELQKKDPGFVVAASRFSLAILPSSETTAAFGQYPDSIMSKSFRNDSFSPVYRSDTSSNCVLRPLTCLYARWLPTVHRSVSPASHRIQATTQLSRLTVL